MSRARVVSPTRPDSPASALSPVLAMVITLGIALGITMGLAKPALSQESGDAAAIRGVIEQQLGAFRADDSGLAYSFASPMIQRKFGSAENFMRMVQTGYPAVYRPREVEFRELALRGNGVPVQEVLFVGQDGTARLAYYVMQRQPDGSWKINGVYLVDAAQSMT